MCQSACLAESSRAGVWKNASLIQSPLGDKAAIGYTQQRRQMKRRGWWRRLRGKIDISQKDVKMDGCRFKEKERRKVKVSCKLDIKARWSVPVHVCVSASICVQHHPWLIRLWQWLLTIDSQSMHMLWVRKYANKKRTCAQSSYRTCSCVHLSLIYTGKQTDLHQQNKLNVSMRFIYTGGDRHVCELISNVTLGK